jgi:hypothetical protein
MSTSDRNVSLGFDHPDICEGQHICLLFRDDEERRRVVSRFMKSGFEADERQLYLVDTMSLDEFREKMSDYGVELKTRGDELDLRQAAPTYCPDGHFESQRMIDALTSFFTDAKADGYPGVRGSGEMTWALSEGRTKTSELFRYEAKINAMQREHPFTVCCQYDTSKFDGNTIMDVLAVHPMVIVNEQLIKNPIYVEPETYLKERQLT